MAASKFRVKNGLDVIGDILVSGLVDGVDVASLGSQVSANTSNISSNASTITSHGTRLDDAESSISSNTSSINSLNTSVSTNASDITSVSNDLSTHEAVSGNGGHIPSAGTSGQFLNHAGQWAVPSGTYVFPGLTGDVTSTGEGANTITDGAVTLAKMADMATDSFLGRDSAGVGAPEVLSASAVRSILNVEDGADVTDAINVAAAGAVMESDSSTAAMSFVIDEDDMASDSDTKVPTQQSVKAYVDARVVSSVDYKGSYDASANSPDLDTSPSGITKGDMYTVTVAGTFFTTAVEVGDVLIAEVDDATLESQWTIVNKNLDDAAIKVAYENNSNTNAFTDAEKTKLGYISATSSADLDTMQSDIALKAPLANPTFTGTAVIPAMTFAGVALTVSGTELNYVDGVTSSIQSQLDSKQSNLTFGIADGDVMKAENTVVAGELAMFTSTGLESKSASEARSFLNVEDGANAYVHPNHTGDVTSTSDGATVIADNKIKPSMLKGPSSSALGNGSDGDYLASAGDGTFKLVTPPNPTVVAYTDGYSESFSLAVGTTTTVVYSFDKTVYRSAKVVLSIKDSVNSRYETEDLVIVHDGTNVFFSEYGSVSSAISPGVSFDVVINGNSVEIHATGTSATNVVKGVATLLNV